MERKGPGRWVRDLALTVGLAPVHGEAVGGVPQLEEKVHIGADGGDVEDGLDVDDSVGVAPGPRCPVCECQRGQDICGTSRSKEDTGWRAGCRGPLGSSIEQAIHIQGQLHPARNGVGGVAGHKSERLFCPLVDCRDVGGRGGGGGGWWQASDRTGLELKFVTYAAHEGQSLRRQEMLCTKVRRRSAGEPPGGFDREERGASA